MLIASDLHLGKTGHFRKSGIAIPSNLYEEDLQQLDTQIQHFNPTAIVFVGDLFHSFANREHETFVTWRKEYPNITMHLVKGNHDILKTSDYSQMQLIIHEQELVIGAFCFVHDTANTQIEASTYYISGHIHPGIQMKGLGKQSLKFPCFYFGESIGILPAFGKFTGLAILEPTTKDTIFAIVNQQVIKVHG